jgi:myo-inositol-1(or 4)-monophosphatase
MLNVAVRAARAAGRIITRASHDLERVKVASKERNDFVTEVDHAAEQAIITELQRAYPGHAFLAEESGHQTPKGDVPPQEAEHLWIIDPLDGTTNFIHGLPQYCISIALMQRGVVTQGLVYDPNRDELYTASKGGGAFLNDRRIRVSRATKVEGALIGTGFPFRKLDDLDRYLELFKLVTHKAAGVRRPGAAALDLAYVAAGRFDGFFELGLMPWDIAAGALLVSEAGGLMGNLQGDGDYLFSGDVLAASPKVFSQMVALFGTVPAH